VFDRYRIVSERDLADGLAKLANTTESARPRTQSVVQFKAGK
jgi:hypothetical protein